MSTKVTREDIVDYQTYGDQRESFQRHIFEIKKPRRVHLGDHLTFLFENHDTVRYQIQEMMRAEQIVREEAIRHEIETYNQLVGVNGQIGCSLLIEIDDPAERRTKLEQWLSLPKHVYVRLAGGQKIYARYDERQVGEDRLSAVQYLIFDSGGEAPEALGSDLPALELEQPLSTETQAALREDLREDPND